MQIYARRNGFRVIERLSLDKSARWMDKYKIFECIYKHEIDKKYKLQVKPFHEKHYSILHCTFGFPRMGVVSVSDNKNLKKDVIRITESLSYTPITIKTGKYYYYDYRTLSYHTHRNLTKERTKRGFEFEHFKSKSKKSPIHWTLISKISYMKLIASINY